MRMPRGAYRNYAIRAPRKTHMRPATCQEVDCPAYANGWEIQKELLTPELLYAATNSGRRFREERVAEGRTLLKFYAGQPCFASHEVSLERPAFFYAGPGRNETFSIHRATQFQRPEDWQDDMQTNLDVVRKIRERG